MVGVEVLGLNPDNGSHFDVLLGVPLLVLALVAFLVYQRRQKRARRAAYEERRMSMKALIAHTPSPMSFRMPKGEVLDQGPHGSSVGYATTHSPSDPFGEMPEADERLTQTFLYESAKSVDPWDEPESDGATIAATMKHARERGFDADQ